MAKNLPKLPWGVDEESVHAMWTDSISIVAADGGHVAHLTRGLESYSEPPHPSAGESSPAFKTARLIVVAVNNHAQLVAMLRCLAGKPNWVDVRAARELLARIDAEERRAL